MNQDLYDPLIDEFVALDPPDLNGKGQYEYMRRTQRKEHTRMAGSEPEGDEELRESGEEQDGEEQEEEDRSFENEQEIQQVRSRYPVTADNRAGPSRSKLH